METLKISSLSAGQVPKVLADYISPGEWATFHINMTKAKQEICMKAVCASNLVYVLALVYFVASAAILILKILWTVGRSMGM